jgi:hypothetical protein
LRDIEINEERRRKVIGREDVEVVSENAPVRKRTSSIFKKMVELRASFHGRPQARVLN